MVITFTALSMVLCDCSIRVYVIIILFVFIILPRVLLIVLTSFGLCRYLLEECLEIQLWLCESVRDHDNGRPNSRDILVGTASIPLLPLACIEGHSDSVTIK